MKRLIDADTRFHTNDFDSISCQADTVNKDTVCKFFYSILVWQTLKGAYWPFPY